MMKVFVVIPNWNRIESIGACLDSLLHQSFNLSIIVVDNGSTDGSLEHIQNNYPQVELVVQQKNLGFAGGVNVGVKRALDQDAKYVALFNNDAVAHQDWLKHLVEVLEQNPQAGIVTGKLLSADKKHIDSTGDYYTIWGLPYPRGRGEKTSNKYDDDTEVFGASGGASLYRASMLKEIGLFDEDFFAYYEDVDVSFRAQLSGWKVLYAPQAEAYHQTGSTSSRIKGFTTYHTFKNYPLLLVKNVPLGLLLKVLPRFVLVYVSIGISSLIKGRGWPAFRGGLAALMLLPKKLIERWQIQRSKKVTVEYINSILVHDLPPNAVKLRRLRRLFAGR